MTFTWFDAVLVGIMLISALLALMRGLTRELLSLLSWIGGALAAFFLHPVFRDTARSYFPEDDRLVADIVLAVTIFLVVLIIIALLTMRISDWVLESGVGVLDRTLGFIFGLGRGLLIVVVAYLFFVWWVPNDQPSGMRNARSLPLVDGTAKIIMSYLPPELAEMLIEKTTRDDADDTPDTEPAPQDSTEKDDNASLDAQPNGYDGTERSSLNQLLQSTQDAQN